MRHYRALIRRMAGGHVSDRSTWQWLVLGPHLVGLAIRRRTLCRLGWHRWFTGHGVLGGRYLWCEACPAEKPL
jgi:hypothetical protein